MPDLEKVIKGLECCILRDPDDKQRCSECPYEGNCVNRLKMDALHLLKAQEPIEPIKHLSTGQICGSCKKVLLRRYKYCPACGKEVRWK